MSNFISTLDFGCYSNRFCVSFCSFFLVTCTARENSLNSCSLQRIKILSSIYSIHSIFNGINRATSMKCSQSLIIILQYHFVGNNIRCLASGIPWTNPYDSIKWLATKGNERQKQVVCVFLYFSNWQENNIKITKYKKKRIKHWNH